jgi:gamma-glutamyltranspeptidase
MRSALILFLGMLAPLFTLSAQETPLRGKMPAFSAEGRLVLSSRGDLWVLPEGLGGGAAFQVTSGPAWDRDPVWAPDGSSLIFSSDRAGGLDLFRVAVTETGPAAEPVHLTRGHDPSGRPDGSIVFVRDRGAAANLWERQADGAERQLTRAPGSEVEPAVSPDGSRIAYVSVRDGRRELHLLGPGDKDVVLHPDRAAENPAWAPDGERIVFATSGQNPGTWVTATDGSWLVLASRTRAQPAWTKDGEWLVLAEAPPTDLSYNGDPDRLTDRAAGDVFREEGAVRAVRAPDPPDQENDTVRVVLRGARETLNADAFDRVWQRTADLYFAAETRWAREALETWRAARERHRPQAIAAPDDAALEASIHALLRDRPPARPAAEGRAAVSSAHPLATAAGVEILEAGGNVVDAAVAVSFALGVVEPDASGVGGYGEMLIHLAGMTEPVVIEFMTRLPEAHSAGLERLAQDSAHGALLANVPGTVAGMELAWRKHGSGRISWAQLIEPAIRIAESGFVLDDAFATTLAREEEAFARYESSRALFFRGERPLQAGDTLRNPDLAWTLRQIASGGADAFYRGEVANRLVSDLSAHGNPITRTDLRRYFAAERRPVRTTYRGQAIYSGAPPVTGGATLVAKLNLLENVAPGTSPTDDAAKLHAMIEAWKLQPATAERIADPDLWPTDVTPFERKDTATRRWRCFNAERASPPNVLNSDTCATANSNNGEHTRPGRSTGTTAFAVADANGNAVSVTQTLGTWGGNFYVTPGLGFIYNDKFTSYRSDPNAYGARLPYARNTTVISPTIIYDSDGPEKRPIMALGAAGNAWITSAVYAMVVGVVDHGLGPQEVLELPRMLPSGGTTQIEDGFAPEAIARLENLGHTFRRISLKGELRMGYGAAVMIKAGRAIAGADPRRSGAAGAAR